MTFYEHSMQYVSTFLHTEIQNGCYVSSGSHTLVLFFDFQVSRRRFSFEVRAKLHLVHLAYNLDLIILIAFNLQNYKNFFVLCSEKSQSPLFNQYKTCAQHQSLVNGLSCILQVITICCPGALIWNSAVTPVLKPGSSSEQSKRNVTGSALDRLALSPSELPLPSGFSSPVLRKQVRDGVTLISNPSWGCYSILFAFFLEFKFWN